MGDNLDSEKSRRVVRSFGFSKSEIELMLSDDRAADRIFDSVLPKPYKDASEFHWTKARVVRKVAEWLSGTPPEHKLIDVGSGVGKFCILLGLRSKVRIFGIEQRSKLHWISSRIRNENILRRVNFIHGNMMDLDWSEFDIYYFYNPFQEHLSDIPWTKVDREIHFDRRLYAKYIGEVFRQLVWAKKGKRLITYHGHGGLLPSCWEMMEHARFGDGDLIMWEKVY